MVAKGTGRNKSNPSSLLADLRPPARRMYHTLFPSCPIQIANLPFEVAAICLGLEQPTSSLV